VRPLFIFGLYQNYLRMTQKSTPKILRIAISASFTPVAAFILLLISFFCESFPRIMQMGMVIIVIFGSFTAYLSIKELTILKNMTLNPNAKEQILHEAEFRKRQEEEKYESLFHRADELIRKDKLYLLHKFTITDLAHMLGSNRTDVSTAFGIHASGYCNYFNELRIQEGTSIMNDNPHLKVEDIAERSGFGSANNFTKVFREKMMVTPRDYLADIRGSRHRQKLI